MPQDKLKGKADDPPAPMPTETETPKETPQPTDKSQKSSASVVAPPTPALGKRTTEIPTLTRTERALDIPIQDDSVIGNPKMVFSLHREGMLGVFYDRENTARYPNLVPLNHANYRFAVNRTLTQVLNRLLQEQKYLNHTEVGNASTHLAATLTTGVMVATYMKLRTVNYLDSRCSNRFQQVPKLPAPFMVPAPYALAISQLGRYKSSGTIVEGYYSPVIDAMAPTFLLAQGTYWNLPAYLQAEQFAKSIGMKFATPDLNVKMGSSWWLYQSTMEGPFFSLRCLMPEENFTVNTSVLRTLFCSAPNDALHTNIFELAALGTTVYGSMLRNPPGGVNVSTFFAIDQQPAEMFRFE